jgi:nucleoside-diphosphate-sugar epimerase
MRRLMPQRLAIQVIGEKLPVLVVGGGGYIGTHVVAQLLAGGHRVRVFDRFFYGKQAIADFAGQPRFEVMEGDISNIYELTLALQDVGSVVHLAGIVGDPACSVDDQLTRHINIVNTRMLKESVKAFGIPRFVFASSCSVYGASEAIVAEGSKLNPVSLYARTKIDSEQELLSDTYDLFHPTILRFATVFGHSRRMRFDLVVNLFVAQAYINGVITVKGSGQWRPFVHVSDLGWAVKTVIEAPIPLVSRQVFNVGGDELNITIGELAELVAGVVSKDRRGRKVKVTIDDSIDDQRNYHVSFERIASQLKFAPEIGLRDGIAEMHRAFLSKTYVHDYRDQIYSNVEMTKLIQKEFRSRDFRQSHFTGFVQAPAAA